eukprot:8853244-Alexandrium_andersonii.AAC.1
MRDWPSPACRQTSSRIFRASQTAQLQPTGSAVRQARTGLPTARGEPSACIAAPLRWKSSWKSPSSRK